MTNIRYEPPFLWREGSCSLLIPPSPPPWSAHWTTVAPSPSCSSSFSFSLIWTTVALTKDGFMSCHRPPLESLWSTHNSSTIHTEKLSGVIKIFALTEGAAMLIAEAEYFMVRDVNFGGDQPLPLSSWHLKWAHTKTFHTDITLLKTSQICAKLPLHCYWTLVSCPKTAQ